MATVSNVGCDAVTSVRGVVSDEAQKPVPSALVRLVRIETGNAVESQTDVDGSFVVTIIHGLFPGRFTVTVSKQGFVTFSAEVRPNTIQKLKVVLVRAEDAKQRER